MVLWLKDAGDLEINKWTMKIDIIFIGISCSIISAGFELTLALKIEIFHVSKHFNYYRSCELAMKLQR